MPSLPVCRFPHPVLTKVAEPVVDFDRELQKIIKNLIDTMYSGPGTVGLAAPQVARSLQIFITKPNDKTDFQIFINPKIMKTTPVKKVKQKVKNKFSVELHEEIQYVH